MFGVFKINILFLAINCKGMAIPILWTLLPKKGCWNTAERILSCYSDFKRYFLNKSYNVYSWTVSLKASDG